MIDGLTSPTVNGGCRPNLSGFTSEPDWSAEPRRRPSVLTQPPRLLNDASPRLGFRGRSLLILASRCQREGREKKRGWGGGIQHGYEAIMPRQRQRQREIMTAQIQAEALGGGWPLHSRHMIVSNAKE